MLAVKKLGMCIHRDNGNFYVKGSGLRVKSPKIDSDFALFLGILSGDGWLASRKVAEKNYSWRIGMVEDDRPLISHFVKLVYKVFGLYPKINDRKTKVEAYFNSKIIYEILNKEYNFPDGDKINRLRIPNRMLGSDILIRPFLSGLFSTDGKFVLNKGYPRLCVESASLKFIKDVEMALANLGFNPRFYVWNRKEGNKLYGIYLNGLNQVTMFHNKIGFVGEKANKLALFLKLQPR